MGSGLYLGGIYGVVGEDDGTNDVSSNYLGVSIGYRSSGWQLTAHYFLTAEDELSATSQLTGGSGIGVDLAYLWSINTTFAIGPQLTYRSFKYTKYETGGSETTVDVTQSYSLPYIVFALAFRKFADFLDIFLGNFGCGDRSDLIYGLRLPFPPIQIFLRVILSRSNQFRLLSITDIEVVVPTPKVSM